jgi:pilus assembly protein FimV
MQKILLTLGLTLYFSFTSLSCYAEKPTSFGPVTKGKTLWEIAIALRPDDSVDPFQVAIALMQANPDAFSNRCNYNTLKLKETLTLPPLEQIKAIPAQEANTEFKRQGTQWKNRKTDKITCGSLLEIAEAAPAPAPAEVTPPPVAETKPTPPAAPQPAAPTASMSEPTPATSTAPVTPPAPQPVADVKPAPEAAKSALPAEFTKLISVMLGLFGMMLLIVFIYDRFIDVE